MIVLDLLVNHLINGYILFVRRESLDSCECGLFDRLLFVHVAEHLVVALEHLLWQALKDPGVLKSFQRSHPFNGAPNEALVQEINEVLVGASKDLL